MTRVSRVQRAIERSEQFAAGKDPAAGAVGLVLDELARVSAGEDAGLLAVADCPECGRGVPAITTAEAAVIRAAKALIAQIGTSGWPPEQREVHALAEAIGQVTAHETADHRTDEPLGLPALGHVHADLDAAGNCRDPRCGFNSDIARWAEGTYL